MANRESITLTVSDEQAEAVVAIVDATPQAEHYFDLDPSTGHALDQGVLIVIHRSDLQPTAMRRITITGDGDMLTATGEITDTAEIGRWYDIHI